ncbi:hypothetical protein JVX98_13335 [Ensifer sp. PDNC004]|uniref:hypothetical protein n=1 Tax=Ensifer sp. PDNC004 TaxID=2811423 RepID=UPI0019651ED1|nr:hypothetical protein [Ensifer sp. PDNC004]QRY69198.1 hypothetical protein JVX98_13335 [Ensifer sp. PDNC004]
MSDFIQQYPALFWALLMFVGIVGVILLAMTIGPMFRAFRREQQETQKRETALMGRYHDLQDSIRRSQV